MRSGTTATFGLGLLCFFVVQDPTVSIAEDVKLPVANPTNAGRATRRPPMPIFDAATVQKMLEAIDAPYNASLLKIGYFTRRGAQPLPATEGYALVKAAADKEPIGTLKWYLLQSLIGHASFRVAGLDTSEGFSAYSLIFTTAEKDAANVRSKQMLVTAVRTAVSDYVATVQGRLRQLEIHDDEPAAQAFAAAWTAYLALEGAPIKAVLREPEWSNAIRSAGLRERILPLIDKTSVSLLASRNYGMLKAAAVTYGQGRREIASSLLKAAQPLLPENDINEVGRFYELWVTILAPDDQDDALALQQAIAVQREMIVNSGRGQARLLGLLLRADDLPGVSKELLALQNAGSNERELLEAARILHQKGRNLLINGQPAAAQAIVLLQGHINRQFFKDPKTQEEAQGLLTMLRSIK